MRPQIFFRIVKIFLSLYSVLIFIETSENLRHTICKYKNLIALFQTQRFVLFFVLSFISITELHSHLNLLAMPESVQFSGSPNPKTKFVSKKNSPSNYASTFTNISQKEVFSPAPLLLKSSQKQTDHFTAPDQAKSNPTTNAHEDNNNPEKKR